MSRIKLRQLLNLTEQAPQPQPPMSDPLSPAPAPVAPQGLNAGGEDQTPPTTPDTSPEPEDPGEYDFTKDFRAFEDKKNKAEADAKKVLLDKMNERLLNKTIVANASRGYGQPKTDYTIKSVKKVSVEFWYKDYVVIVSDENDKKYFLTPGINIKIEGSGSEPAPGGEQPATTPGQEQPEADQDNASSQPPSGQETPNGTPPAAPEPEGEPQGVTPQTPDENPTPTPQPAAKVPQPEPQAPQAPQTAPVPPKKKKKVQPQPVAEWVQKDLNSFLSEFMNESVKDSNSRVNFIPYIQETSKVLSESVNATKIKVKLLIPESHMKNVDSREIKLAAVDTMRQRSYSGQYSRGSIEMNKTGRYYLLEYVKEIGWSNN